VENAKINWAQAAAILAQVAESALYLGTQTANPQRMRGENGSRLTAEKLYTNGVEPHKIFGINYRFCDF